MPQQSFGKHPTFSLDLFALNEYRLRLHSLLTGRSRREKVYLCYNNSMKHKSTTLNQAKMLRKNMTEQEKVLWNLLRNNQFYGLKFRRQVPIGNYVADFVCEMHNVIIELDGGQHNEPENIEKDKQRTDFLESKGYKIIRFWNNEIDNNLEGACEVIYRTIFKKD